MRIQLALKRLADIVISLLVLVLFSPIWLLTAVLIKLTSPGPVFFRSVRGRTKSCSRFINFVVCALDLKEW